jgi:hypothetical protein
MDWQDQLISLYVYICNAYRTNLWAYCERRSNRVDLALSDEEVLTIFIFGVSSGRRNVREIYDYTRRHLHDWFPALPSYAAFDQRLNRLCDLFIPLLEQLIEELPEQNQGCLYQLMDSFPIMMARGSRRFHAKVAPGLADKNGYCATKKTYYYGVKLHVVAIYEKGSMPLPQQIGLSPAGVHDRKAYEEILPHLPAVDLFADKAYQRAGAAILQEEGLRLHTPVKKKKGQKYLDAADQLLSTAISRIRQPVESLFNWIEEKAHIQIASKVRSHAGLLVHVFGRLSAALFILCGKLSP